LPHPYMHTCALLSNKLTSLHSWWSFSWSRNSLLQNPNIHHHCHKYPPFNCILSQFNPPHIFGIQWQLWYNDFEPSNSNTRGSQSSFSSWF
jgi:hypothetical protein